MQLLRKDRTSAEGLLQEEKNDLQVRQVEEADPKDTVSNPGTASSATAVLAVQILEPATTHVHVEDLTVFSQPSSSNSPFKINMITDHGGLQFSQCGLCRV